MTKARKRAAILAAHLEEDRAPSIARQRKWKSHARRSAAQRADLHSPTRNNGDVGVYCALPAEADRFMPLSFEPRIVEREPEETPELDFDLDR